MDGSESKSSRSSRNPLKKKKQKKSQPKPDDSPSTERKSRAKQKLKAKISSRSESRSEVSGFVVRVSRSTSRAEEPDISGPISVQHRMHVDENFSWRSDQAPEQQFRLEVRVGNGTYGMVFRAVHIDSGAVLAIKKVVVMDDNVDSVRNEIELLRTCRHPNIVGYYGTYFKGHCLWILMEFCELGSIEQILASVQRLLTEPQIAFVARSIAAGLAFMHSKRIIHRDLKPSNVLMTRDGIIKLADFGVSKKLETLAEPLPQSKTGTELYMAPEVLAGRPYLTQVDLFSLGVLLYELCYTALPYSQHKPPLPATCPPTLPSARSNHLTDLLLSLLQYDPAKRLNADQALAHPFLLDAPNEAVMKKVLRQYEKKKRRQSAEPVLPPPPPTASPPSPAKSIYEYKPEPDERTLLIGAQPINADPPAETSKCCCAVQ